jgi:hypothetical protein
MTGSPREAVAQLQGSVSRIWVMSAGCGEGPVSGEKTDAGRAGLGQVTTMLTPD